MMPAVARKLGIGDRFALQDATVWTVAKFDEGEEFLIAMRSDFFGWIKWRFSAASRLALAATLTGADRDRRVPVRPRSPD